jgi:hypothetical protein
MRRPAPLGPYATTPIFDVQCNGEAACPVPFSGTLINLARPQLRG